MTDQVTICKASFKLNDPLTDALSLVKYKCSQPFARTALLRGFENT